MHSLVGPGAPHDPISAAFWGEEGDELLEPAPSLP